MTDIITYETLYELLRKEKTSQELQQLDKNFFEKLLNYLQEKQKLLESHERKGAIVTINTREAQKEFETIKRMFRELYERRENKIIMLATFSSRSKMQEKPSLMLDEEKKMFSQLVKLLDSFRDGIVENIVSLKPISLEEPPKSIKTDHEEEALETMKFVRFIQPVPKFIDKDLNVYGPFEQEDVANIPRKIADILIGNKRAEEVKNEIRQES